jgi:hypothetical protein
VDECIHNLCLTHAAGITKAIREYVIFERGSIRATVQAESPVDDGARRRKQTVVNFEAGTIERSELREG